ncbi:dynein intermediate chain 3, ciliary-like [Aricia agestis]|uniref:dynein intermediate chain 3, ciliary-like n=1 Tax=Aricia agestis TaxID=91739 RepID=UPI001C20AD84|nr:dynein intermediate chain 3, ciliary-like [Aricia agestis]
MSKDLVYTYIKQRHEFGKQPLFSEVPVALLDSIDPDKTEQKRYGLRNPVHQATQTGIEFAEHEVNTARIVAREQGICHAEGGWPKEISYDDEETTARHRRKYERDDAYIDAVLRTYPRLNHYADQNNAIEMYNVYFKDMPSLEPIEKSSVRVTNVFKDPDERPVSSIAWTSEEDPKLVASYCDKTYPILKPLNEHRLCYVWDVENPIEPSDDFLPPSACWQVACFPGSPRSIIGGLEDGRVCLFDLRAKSEYSSISPMHLAHRDPVSALVFIASRTNTEFFSGSHDGKCMWWDIRNLDQPTDTLIMSVNVPAGEPVSLANSEGVSCLQYERSFPTKFLCGTVTGMVINVNRRGKSHTEIMSAVFQAHNGPVKAVHRSPCTSKVFITCGDWATHIWSDDVRGSPIVSGTGQRRQITDVVWAPHRVSGYMTVGADGKFRYWDLLRKYREPTYTLPISKHPLLKVVPNEEGKLIAIGDVEGAVYLLSLSQNLVTSGDKDKQLMLQCFEREGRREHILEARIKEIKLAKLKSTSKLAIQSSTVLVDDPVQLKTTEDEYRKIVAEEFRRAGVTHERPAPQAIRRK